MRLLSRRVRQLNRNADLLLRSSCRIPSPSCPISFPQWAPRESLAVLPEVHAIRCVSSAPAAQTLQPRDAAIGDHDRPGPRLSSYSDDPPEGFSGLAADGGALDLGLADSPGLPETFSSSGALPPRSYGKWQWLASDDARLEFESDIDAPSQTRRLVDLPENEHDIELWSCLLDFSHRRSGWDGVLKIWQAVEKRHNLHQVDGPAAEAFWGMVLESALPSIDSLRSVWDYAEWLHQAHGVKWPRLYTTTISHLVERSARGALLYHFRLSPNFDPGHREFTELIRSKITVPENQKALRWLYAASIHRSMYDELVPHLYACGEATLAREWRKLLLQSGDEPSSPASRPFLRYLAAYYPQLNLTKAERAVAGLGGAIATPEVDDAQEHSMPGRDVNLRQIMNRVHGKTFGIHEKSYNDALGAKWFATTWLPLDFAITVVRALGVDHIGPLSLQSIVLREHDLDGVRRRLDQLESMQISLGTSHYAKAVRHLTAAGEFTTLQELLHSDLHPDVFDDLTMQSRLLAKCSAAGDWDKHRLILVVRSAVSMDSLTLASNELLQACLRDEGSEMALKMLDEMGARDIPIFPSSSHQVSKCIIRNVPYHNYDIPMGIDFYMSLSRHIAATRFPPAVHAWERILFYLGRQGRLDDLERLSLEAVQLYGSRGASGHTTINVHKFDVPEILKTSSSYPDFVTLPRDLPLSHEDHPLRQIFNQKLQASIVRWGFNEELTRPKEHTRRRLHSEGLADFHVARGVRLLAMLRDEGLYVQELSVRKAVVLRLVPLYGPAGLSARRKARAGRPGNLLTLEEAKDLCDEAWGSELLPPPRELEHEVNSKGRALSEEELDFRSARPRRRKGHRFGIF